MIEVLTTVLAKIIETILSKPIRIRRNKEGAMVLYDLYVRLYNIVELSNDMLNSLREEVLESKTRRGSSSVAFYVDSIVKELNAFVDSLRRAQYTLSIFDREIVDELHDVVGIKGNRLRTLVSRLRKSAGEDQYPIVNKSDWGHMGSIVLKGPPFERLKIKSRMIDLKAPSEKELQQLRVEYSTGLEYVEVLRDTLERYAAVLRGNLKIEDLLPRRIP